LDCALEPRNELSCRRASSRSAAFSFTAAIQSRRRPIAQKVPVPFVAQTV